MNFYELNAKESSKIINFFNLRFGVQKDFFSNKILLKNQNFVFLSTPAVLSCLNFDWPFELIGSTLLIDFKSLKPSSLALTLFNNQVNQNFIELNEEQLKKFLTNELIVLTENNLRNVLSNGFIAIKFNNRIVSSALLEGKKLIPNLPLKKSKSGASGNRTHARG